ncbi:hypothetical protein Baya_2882 [Bagarius yarrelli]|uniref:Uncharacterized protein n=1 Tax=Bagarius yarrelli TaxID=175774 RepID=A0A556TQU3_BAGYA|nr:hypothetical protein Baya_2882 [Bagarius yarrelli]
MLLTNGRAQKELSDDCGLSLRIRLQLPCASRDNGSVVTVTAGASLHTNTGLIRTAVLNPLRAQLRHRDWGLEAEIKERNRRREPAVS